MPVVTTIAIVMATMQYYNVSMIRLMFTDLIDIVHIYIYICRPTVIHGQITMHDGVRVMSSSPLRPMIEQIERIIPIFRIAVLLFVGIVGSTLRLVTAYASVVV